VISPAQKPLPDNTQHSSETDIHDREGIRTHNISKRATVGPRPRPRSHRHRLFSPIGRNKSDVYMWHKQFVSEMIFLLGTTNKMQRFTIFFIIINALQVSGGFSNHHQELNNCIHSIW
jgi:hypothetical protein